MDYFYDGQVRRYLTQFINILSNFSYKDAKGQIVRVPVRYGDMSRQVSQILKKNSENTLPSAPFIACYIKDLQFDRPRLQDPTFISKLQIRERAFDEDGNEYLNVQGDNYTVERIMPSPYLITFAADIWSTNTDMKLQIWEQIVVFFNPSFEIQTTDNYIDWTSLSTITLENQTWSSRSIPQGINEDIDILTMSFTAPIWITPPAKVKKLGIVTKIISNVYASDVQGTVNSVYGIDGGAEIFANVSPDTSTVVTPGNYSLLLLNNTARLIVPNGRGDDIDISNPNNTASWLKILDLHPGKFRAGLSQLRFTKPDGTEIIAYMSLNPSDDFEMILNIDQDTVPSNTVIENRGTVDAIINPETFNPINKYNGVRYLILEDINVNDQYGDPNYTGPGAWKNDDSTDFQAYANDIIVWSATVGRWFIVFDSSTVTENDDPVYVTNSYTGIQYKWDGVSWSKSYEGVYDPVLWRMIL